MGLGQKVGPERDAGQDQAPSSPTPQPQGVSPPPVLLPVASWIASLVCGGWMPLTPSDLLSTDPQRLQGVACTIGGCAPADILVLNRGP